MSEDNKEVELECPPCKLLLNSGGLIGLMRGIFATKKELNRRGKDFSPEFYKKAEAIVCGAHKELAKLEGDALKSIVES